MKPHRKWVLLSTFESASIRVWFTPSPNECTCAHCMNSNAQFFPAEFHKFDETMRQLVAECINEQEFDRKCPLHFTSHTSIAN